MLPFGQSAEPAGRRSAETAVRQQAGHRSTVVQRVPGQKCCKGEGAVEADVTWVQDSRRVLEMMAVTPSLKGQRVTVPRTVRGWGMGTTGTNVLENFSWYGIDLGLCLQREPCPGGPSPLEGTESLLGKAIRVLQGCP